MTITDRSVLVTGANRGTGQAFVEEAQKRGAKRVYAGTRQPLAHPDERVTALTLDVTPTSAAMAESWRSGAVKDLSPSPPRPTGPSADSASTPIHHIKERTMNVQNFTAAFTVEETPEQVFAAINDVRGWWSGDIEGSTDQLGDEWTYRYQDVHYSKQEITELIPGQRVAWHVLDGYLNFTQDTTEWTGTDITFDVSKEGDKTEVRFTHVGLVPEFECFDNCSNAWGFYINGSLRSLITTGKGEPNETE